MKRRCVAALMIGVSLMGTASGAQTVTGTETYDLLFREGTLNALDKTATLIYRRDVTNALNPEAGANASGDVALMIDDGDGDGMARLELRQGAKSRGLGVFPASVGNPMIMMFYETVIRDMASTAGGSPFYIRNRVKESLVQPSQVVAGETEFDGRTISTRTISLRPFEGDPNADRMRGFGNLEMKVTMSDEVPGWYVSLSAEAGDAAQPVYRTDTIFDRLEAAK